MKICTKCSLEYKSYLKKGKGTWCKKCHYEWNRRYRKRPEVVKAHREYLRRYRQKNLTRVRLLDRKHSTYQRLKNHKQFCARQIVRHAVNMGFLKKPKTCALSNQDCYSRIEAHHDNYNKPLDVIWLCRYHHNAKHVELKRERGKV